MDDILLYHIAPYLPPLAKRRLSMINGQYHKSREFVDKLTQEWLDQKVGKHASWKYDTDLLVFDMTRKMASICYGTHLFNIPEYYEVRHTHSVSSKQWIVLLEPVTTSLVYIGLLVDSTDGASTTLAQFEFRIDTPNKHTIRFQYATLENSILTVCYYALLTSQSNRRKMHAMEFHLNSWDIKTKITTQNPPMLTRRQLPRTLRGLFSPVSPRCVGLADGRLYNQHSYAFCHYSKGSKAKLLLTEMKQSALLMDDTEPSSFEIDIQTLLKSNKYKLEFTNSRVLRSTLNWSSPERAILATFAEVAWGKSYSVWVVIHDYNLIANQVVFKGKLMLENNRPPYIFDAFFEKGMLILTSGGDTDYYRHYCCSYQHPDDEVYDLRLMATTRVNKSYETKLV